MDGLAWLGVVRSRLLRRSYQTELVENKACYGCTAVHKTRCCCRLGLFGFCKVRLRALPLGSGPIKLVDATMSV